MSPNADELFEERCLAHGFHYCMKCLNENRAQELKELRLEIAKLKADMKEETFFVLKVRGGNEFILYEPLYEKYKPLTMTAPTIETARHFSTEKQADEFRFIGHLQNMKLDLVKVTHTSRTVVEKPRELRTLTQNEISDYWRERDKWSDSL